MLGGHLDSWHAGTGATDNAIGCSVMMEAARILTAIGVKPRRTIRVALWSGEEQGLLGSQAYVREHFGTLRGAEAGVREARRLLQHRQRHGPRARHDDLRPAGGGDDPARSAGVVRGPRTAWRDDDAQPAGGGTDAFSFAAAGLPGINALQDPIEYQSYTWHTNLDTYERVVEDDVKKSAIVMAAAVYHVAMRDELLPRFTAEQMPRRPEAPAQTAAPAAQNN